MRMDGDAKIETATKRQNRFHNLRYIVIITGGMAMGFMQFLRNSITVAMVSMVNHTQIFINAHPNVSQEEVQQYVEHAHEEMGEFDWNNEKQEEIISSYMITYMLCQFPMAKLVSTYGVRAGICLTLALSSLFNTLTPIASYWGWYWALILRLGQGGAASGLAPSMIGLTESWTAKGCAADGYVLYQFIAYIFIITTPILGGALASYHWKWAYYVPGVATVIFCIYWCILISDKPEESKFVSQKELDYLKGTPVTSSPKDLEPEKPKLKVPISAILKVKEFYSLVFLWSMYWASASVFFILLPAYVHRVFQVPVDQVGSQTTLAQLGAVISMLWPNRAVDFFMNRFNMSLTNARKIVVAICVLVANVTSLWLACYHSNLVLVININRVFHMALDTLFTATLMSQFGELGLSTLVYSIVNSISCMAGSLFCVLVGRFLDYTGDTLECWSWIYVTVAVLNALYLIVNTFFCHSNPVDAKSILPQKCESDTKNKLQPV